MGKHLRFGAPRAVRSTSEERHLFECSECRAQVRLDRDWQALAEFEPQEIEASPAFVASVLAGVSGQSAPAGLAPFWRLAAALLLFAFAAGLAWTSVERSAQASDTLTTAFLGSPSAITTPE
jgi:hypothetical protein